MVYDAVRGVNGCDCAAATKALADATREDSSGEVLLSTCFPCPLGSSCSGKGASLASLPLEVGYWRASADSADIRRCPITGTDEPSCAGREGGCKALTAGPYCRLCDDELEDHYFDNVQQSCLPCSGSQAATLAGFLSVFPVLVSIAIAIGISSTACSRRCRSTWKESRLARWLKKSHAFTWRILKQTSLVKKGKITVTFYQIATSIQSVFLVIYPADVESILAAFRFLAFNFTDLNLAWACFGLGAYTDRLLFFTLSPLIFLIPTLPLGAILSKKHDTTRLHRLASVALPTILAVLFFIFPSVTSIALQGMETRCECFDVGAATGECFLRADLALKCGSGDPSTNELHEWTPEYQHANAIAWMAIVLYPVGVPAVFLLLLFTCRKSLLGKEKETPLSHALNFLHSEYKPQFFYWEVVELAKKFYFVGFSLLIPPGTLRQLVAGIAVSVFMLVMQVSAMPYRTMSNNMIASSTAVSLLVLMLGALVIKISVLTDTLSGRGLLTDLLLFQYSLPTGLLSAVLITSILGTVIAIGFVLMVKLYSESQSGFVSPELWAAMQVELKKTRRGCCKPKPSLGVSHDISGKFDSTPKYMVFGAAQTFVNGLKGQLESFGCTGDRSIREEFASNDGGKWLKELTYVWEQDAMEAYPSTKGEPWKPEEKDQYTRDLGHGGMTLDDFVESINEGIDDVAAKISKVQAFAARMYTGPWFIAVNFWLRFGPVACTCDTTTYHDKYGDPQPASTFRLFTPDDDGKCRVCKKGIEEHHEQEIDDWATTASVLYDTIIKLSMVTAPTTVYRGIKEDELRGFLPPAFVATEGEGFRGGVEMAFMSTTVDPAVAVEYSGGMGAGGSIVQIEFDLANRGAKLQALSQYPAEVELLFPPVTALTVEEKKQVGPKRVLHVRAAVSTNRPHVAWCESVDSKPPPGWLATWRVAEQLGAPSSRLFSSAVRSRKPSASVVGGMMDLVSGRRRSSFDFAQVREGDKTALVVAKEATQV